MAKKRSNKPKSVRLFSAVRKLNVAMETIVSTLEENEFELDAKLLAGDPNAKLAPEMYDVLLATFAEDAEAAERIRDLREQRSAEAEVPDVAPAEEPAPEPVAEEAPAPEPEPAEEPEPEPEPEEEPVAPAEPVIDLPEPEEEPVAPAEPVIDLEEAEPAEAEVEVEEAPEAETVAEAPEEAPEEAPSEEAVEEPKSVEEASEAASEAPEEEAAEPAAETTEVEPASESAETGEKALEGEGDGTVLRADRYNLGGTTVVGSIDLSQIDGGNRRKRKKTKAADAGPAPSTSTKSKGRKGKKGRGPQVDKGEVESNVQQTLQDLAGRSGGGRSNRRSRRRERREERAAERQLEMERMEELASTLRVMEFVSTGELAELMRVPVTDVIQTGFGLGIMVSINQRLDADTITLIADEFGFDVEFISDLQEVAVDIAVDEEEDLEDRSPVVTIMGHVDHGKTSLLDYIREANVVAGEAGGITQHIGAYEVTLGSGKELTFLDTPGHEAFTAMRARGAQVTDLVIVVVAADDQVMPQTIEAINHSQAAEVPIVVAINKIDRDTANPEKIMQQLSEQNVLVEQYGGQVQCELVSAKTGEGVKDLLDKVLVEAELMELKANPDRDAVGTVIEARLDKGRGVVATVLVQTGTLKIGDPFVAGMHSGRVRAMFDERDNRVEEAGPSTPVAILGFSGSPDVGDRFLVMEDERDARDVAQKRQQLQREQIMHARKHISLADLSRRMALGELTQLNLVIKGDVGGSVEALSDALLKIESDEVAVNIVHSGVGAITENDVNLAVASDAIIIGFQVRPMTAARVAAEREEIDIRTYSVIYDAIEDVRDALEGLLSPEETENITGSAEVRDTFRAPRVGTIAGCYVLDGKIKRSDKARLIRDGVVVYDSSISSLRRFKDDVREVASGYECGLSLEGFNDIKVGDQVEVYELVEQRRELAL